MNRSTGHTVTSHPKKHADSDIPCSGVKVCTNPTCQSDGQPQSVLAFAAFQGSPDGLRYHCRACESRYQKQYRARKYRAKNYDEPYE